MGGMGHHMIDRTLFDEKLEIERPDDERRTFLSAAATIPPERVTAPVLLRHRASEDEPIDATADEVMVTWLARQLDNSSVCSVGSLRSIPSRVSSISLLLVLPLVLVRCSVSPAGCAGSPRRSA